jgi:uncharacterized membrane protein YjgN (DUF898 family)
MLKNIFFTIITLGVYRAWAKTNTRRFIWENITFMEDRGKYVGTGEELFRGWAKLLGILSLVYFLAGLVKTMAPSLSAPFGLVVGLTYIVLMALATYSGLRYRLSRTMWRQIRFGVDKNISSTEEFLILYLKGIFFSVITLGIYIPIFRNKVRTFLTNKMRLGSVYFIYDGKDRDYLSLYFKGMALSLITLGIYIPWFIARLVEFRLKHTSFQDSRFVFTFKGFDIGVQFVLSYLLIICTLGLATPWVFNRIIKKIAENVYLEGSLDLSVINQRESDGSAMADDIVGGYDLDLGF